MKSADLIGELKAAGWVLDRVPGSHHGFKHPVRPEYAGWTFGVINVDPAALDVGIERVNITLPRRVLLRLDVQARAAGESRSGYIAPLTLEERRERRA